MSQIIEIQTVKSEARVDSRVLAVHLKNSHKAVMQLIDTHKTRFEKFGPLPFKMAKGLALPQGGFAKSTRYSLLNEDQSYLLLAFSKNTDYVADLKVELVQSFARFRRHQQTEADYLPFYHELHDQVKVMHETALLNGSTTPERILHLNVNKMINTAFGLESGQRPSLPGHLRAKITAANVFANEAIQRAIENGLDHKAAFQLAKRSVYAIAENGTKQLFLTGDAA
ncbi:MAG: Rha family transcriptional regulator [Methylobacter sp.]